MKQTQKKATRKEERIARGSPPAGALVVERLFDATPERLWAFWTDPEKYARWFNPARGIDLVIHEFDVRPGGRVKFDMPQPDGEKNPQEGVFHIIEPYNRIVSGAPDKSFLIEVRFTPEGPRTRMTVTVTGLSPDTYGQATRGWNAGFDKLESALEPVSRTGERKGTRSELKDIDVTRVFDAPVDRLWRAWTDPEWVKKWWGPRHFTSPYCRIDLKVGGKYLFCMRSPDGKDFWSTGVYREIVPMSRIVCTDSFADEKGDIVPATYYGLSEDYPLELIITVTFEDLGGRTRMTVQQSGHPAGDMYRGAYAGWNESLDKLAESVRRTTGGTGGAAASETDFSIPSDREVVVSRIFDAPPDRVFRAYTDPEALPEWWGPRGYETRIEKTDLRPGGAWRFVQLGPDRKEYAFRGTYREVTRPRRLVQTFEFEGVPGHVLVQTATFEESSGGKTKLTVRALFETVEDRDGMLKTGMEYGWRESMDRLDEFLRK